MSLYLLTFIIAFSRTGHHRWRIALRVLPPAVIGLAYMLLSEATQPVWLLISLHLLVFFLAALVCHGQLASERPDPSHLTEFYLWISVGGVLGGLFNALVAPVVFTRIAEYPMAVVLACLLRPGSKTPASPRARWLDLVAPLGIAMITALLSTLVLPTTLPLQLRLGLAFGVPLLACYAAVEKPLRFALAVAAVLWVSSFYPGTHGKAMRLERNFFGVLRVTRDPIGPFYRLVHGNTIHGRQWIDPARHREPLSYYHITGPLGQVSKSAKPISPAPMSEW